MGQDDDARQQGAAPGSGAADPQGSPPEPGDDKGDQGEAVELDGRQYTKADLMAIIGSRKSLEREVKEARGRLKEMEEKDMDEKDKAQRRADEAERKNAELEKRLIQVEAQRVLDAKLGPGKVSAKYLNLEISSVDGVAEAVETFIRENPGLVQAPGAPRREEAPPPPGGGPPAGAPQRVDKEAQLLEQLNSATTEAELNKAKKAIDEHRGARPDGGRRTI